jgi:hypothetical protein
VLHNNLGRKQLNGKHNASEGGGDRRHSPSYVSRCVNGGDKVVNKTFISMMVGVDVGE